MEIIHFVLIAMGLFFVNLMAIYVASKSTSLDLTILQIIVVSAVAAIVDPLLIILFNLFKFNSGNLIYIISTIIFALTFKIISDEDFWPDLTLAAVVARIFHTIVLVLFIGLLS